MAKILGADDDAAMTEYYKALFSEAGFEVETAADGADTLDKYLEVHPDLLILDVDMPNGGGERHDEGLVESAFRDISLSSVV